MMIFIKSEEPNNNGQLNRESYWTDVQWSKIVIVSNNIGDHRRGYKYKNQMQKIGETRDVVKLTRFQFYLFTILSFQIDQRMRYTKSSNI